MIGHPTAAAAPPGAARSAGRGGPSPLVGAASLRRSTVLTLIGVALVAAVFARFWALTSVGFNSDEAVYSGQAAALSGNATYAHLFGVFRAHPLLVQFLVSVIDRAFGVGELGPRALCAVAGVALAGVAGLVAWRIIGPVGGLLAMAFVAVSPFAVVVSRQMLLDGPEALFAGLTLLLLVMHAQSGRRLLLYGAAAAAGLTFLCKETGILIGPAVAIYLLFARDIYVRRIDLLGIAGVYIACLAPYPISLALGGGGQVAQQFFVWQLFRRPNHPLSFYFTDVAPSIGIPLLVFAAVGIFLAFRRRRGLDIMLLSFTIVPLLFYVFWPVKGFEYILPLVVPLTVLAVQGVFGVAGALAQAVSVARDRQWHWARLYAGALAIVCVVPMIAGTVNALASPRGGSVAATGTDSEDLSGPVTSTFIAGTGGLQGGREAGQWIRQHTLAESNFLTIGPSFANIIQFYGLRRALGLSVSPNPLNRNPVYQPVPNPDLLIRSGAIQYLVYDRFSAARTTFFANRLLQLVKKYHGTVVYSSQLAGGGSAVTIWAVRP